MSDEPLNIDVDLSQVDTTIPVIPQALYDLTIADMKKDDNKDKDGYNLIVTFKTVDPVVSVQGKPVNPGFPLKKWYPLQPSKKEGSTFDFKVPLAMLLDAAYGSTQGTRPSSVTSDLLGKKVRAMVKVEQNQDGATVNSIGNLTHPA